MSQLDKLEDRLRRKPKDFTWDELEKLLSGLGYKQAKPGKAGGSRRRFIHGHAPVISLHKPHPANVLRLYQVEQILETLTEEGLL